jgi:hypothetical protein
MLTSAATIRKLLEVLVKEIKIQKQVKDGDTYITR